MDEVLAAFRDDEDCAKVLRHAGRRPLPDRRGFLSG